MPAKLVACGNPYGIYGILPFTKLGQGSFTNFFFFFKLFFGLQMIER